MTKPSITLPTPVLDLPHWRVNIRPVDFQKDRIATLPKLDELVEKTKVRLRGWDFPHIDHRADHREMGNDYVGSWCDFRGTHEYWRLYQSGQFLHLDAMKELYPSWHEKLKEAAKSHLGGLSDVNWDKVPGFVSVVNFLYRMTEIFEFAARLCQAGVYEGSVSIRIDLKKIKGFVLMVDSDRSWSLYRAATANEIGNEWSLATDILVAQSAERALDATEWFFHRFGWSDPPREVLKKDQKNFLEGRM